jgi:hypothetical protein
VLVTLVVGVATPDGGVWMGGERFVGTFDAVELATPKVFRLETGDGVPFLVGFAGAPRVAQVILAVHPADRDRENRSLHWWLTDFCDRIRDAASGRSLMRDPQDSSECYLAGHSGLVVGIDGHVVLVDHNLSWEEKTRGWEANGGAYESFNGAFLVLRDQVADPVEAARRAWSYARALHRIGPLVDELTIPPSCS